MGIFWFQCNVPDVFYRAYAPLGYQSDRVNLFRPPLNTIQNLLSNFITTQLELGLIIKNCVCQETCFRGFLGRGPNSPIANLFSSVRVYDAFLIPSSYKFLQGEFVCVG